MSSKSSKLLLSTKHIHLIKTALNRYDITFRLKNNNINIANVIDFNIFKMILDMNPDIFEKYSIHPDPHDNTSAHLDIVIKHLLKDIGIPQMHTEMKLTKTVDSSTVILLDAIVISSFDSLENGLEQLPIHRISIACDVSDVHNIAVNIAVYLTGDGTDTDIGDMVATIAENHLCEFVEKMASIIVKNIIMRLKQFIENMTYNVL